MQTLGPNTRPRYGRAAGGAGGDGGERGGGSMVREGQAAGLHLSMSGLPWMATTSTEAPAVAGCLPRIAFASPIREREVGEGLWWVGPLVHLGYQGVGLLSLFFFYYSFASCFICLASY